MFTERQVFRCQNRDCSCEIVIIKTPAETRGRRNPRCVCGAEMKKRYSPPVFRTLDPDDELVSRFEEDRDLIRKPLGYDSNVRHTGSKHGNSLRVSRSSCFRLPTEFSSPALLRWKA